MIIVRYSEMALFTRRARVKQVKVLSGHSSWLSIANIFSEVSVRLNFMV